ncbi:MAG: hypothetical protein ACE361_19875 [Aureliella sp.]
MNQPADDQSAQPADGEHEKGPEGEAAQPEATNLDANQMARFVTSIKNPVQQMGEHVLGALQHPNTMAVMTTVVTGPGGQQHIVSAALNPQQTAMVNAILQGATQEREEEEICVGFHCLVKPKNDSPEKTSEEGDGNTVSEAAEPNAE